MLDGKYTDPRDGTGAASFANHPDKGHAHNLVGQLYAVRWREEESVFIIPVYVLVARHDIKAGQELTHAYSDVYGAAPTQKLVWRRAAGHICSSSSRMSVSRDPTFCSFGT